MDEQFGLSMDGWMDGNELSKPKTDNTRNSGRSNRRAPITIRFGSQFEPDFWRVCGVEHALYYCIFQIRSIVRGVAYHIIYICFWIRL